LIKKDALTNIKDFLFSSKHSLESIDLPFEYHPELLDFTRELVAVNKNIKVKINNSKDQLGIVGAI
jgi:hypothetical protein